MQQNSSAQRSDANNNVLQPKVSEKTLRDSENELSIFQVQSGGGGRIQRAGPASSFSSFTGLRGWLPRTEARFRDQRAVSTSFIILHSSRTPLWSR